MTTRERPSAARHPGVGPRSATLFLTMLGSDFLSYSLVPSSPPTARSETN
jgi:hypothetical protein